MYDDHRNLCTWKKLPDAQLAEYVYDNGGRLTQQGECTNKTVSSDQVVHVQNWAVRVSRRASSRTTLRATVKGSLTGSAVTVSGSSTKIYKGYYYDVKGRVTKVVQNNLLGAVMT